MNEQLRLLLERLGLSVDKEYTEQEVQSALFEAVSKNPTFSNQYINAPIRKAVEDAEKEMAGVLVSKAKQAANGLGANIDKEEVDIKNIINSLDGALKQKYSKGDKDKQVELDRAMQEKRDLELKLQQKESEFTSKFEQQEEEHKGKLSAVETNADSFIQFLQIPLVESARKNAKAFHSTVQAIVSTKADIVKQNGKYVAYKKGTQEPMYKEGSSEVKTPNDLFVEEVKALGWYKETEVTGGGDPNRGGGANPQPKEEGVRTY